MREKVLILGAGGHAKVVIDTIEQDKFEIIGLIDSNEKHLHENVHGIEIIGCDKNLNHFYPQKAGCAFVAIGHMGQYQVRNKIFTILENIGYKLINVIHFSSIIAPSVQLGKGNLILPQTVLNAEVIVGNNNIINTGTIVEHEVSIGNGVHLAPGSTICGGGTISDNVFVGAGSVIIQGISIGKNSIIGAGSVVLSDIPENVIAVGTPAKIIKRRL